MPSISMVPCLRDWLARSVVHRVAATALLLTMLVAGVVGTASFVAVYQLIRQNEQASLDAHTRLLAQQLSSDLNVIARDIADLSTNSFIANGLVDSTGRDTYLLPFLRDHRIPTETPIDVVLADFRGRPFAASRPLDLSAFQSLPGLREALATGLPQAQILRDPAGNVLLLWQQVIFPPTGRVEGLLLARFNLNHLVLEHLPRLEDRAHGDLYAFDAPLILGPNHDSNHDAADHSLNSMQPLRLVPPLDGLGLGVHTHLDSASVFGPIRLAVLLYMAVALATLLVVAVLSRLAARRLTAPLVALSKTANTIAQSGQTDKLAPVMGNDEVGRLAIAFNAMLARLASRSAELKIALETATEVDRMKSEFMANVTHELRTPLNSVIGFSELLHDGVAGPLNAKQAGFVADILASGERLLALVEGILEMSRLDAAALEREPVDVAAALAESVAAHREAAAARGLTLTLEVAPAAGSAQLDPRALRRMLDALTDNAIKFNREGGRVALGARRDGGWLEIAVADSGIGIAHEDLGKLFHPLLQLDSGLARAQGGIGMGLALARRLAELHGGTIEVASEPGTGSTFTLRLPIKETP